MMQFEVSLTAYGSLIVEAESEDEAIQKARDMSQDELRAQMGGVEVDEYAVEV